MTLGKYAKKVTLGTRERMSTKTVARYKILLTKQVENLRALSNFNTKTFSALNFAQDFGTIVKEL